MKYVSAFDLQNIEFYVTHLLCLHKHSLTNYHSAYQFDCAKANIKKIQPLSYIPTNETLEGDLYKFKKRKHHTNLLLWLEKNWIQFTFNHQTLNAPTNSLVLVPKGAVYEATEPKSTPFMFAEFDLFDTEGEEIVLGQQPTLLFKSCPELVQQNFNELYNAFAGIEAKSAMHCNTILYQLLLNISAEKSVISKTKIEQSVLQVITYLRRHYCETINMNELCKISLLSSTQLRQSFKKYTGCTMVEFKNNLRVENAKIQLLKTNLSVKDIATQLGFENVFYFSKVFKQLTGVSPSEFKALHKEKI